MDNFVDERDYKLLENDKFTFFVLRRIIGGKCELLLSDHEKLIICYSCSPYPVWIWSADDASEFVMEIAYQEALNHSLLDENHQINLKYDLANYFINRAAGFGKTLSICKNMFAYECPVPLKPINLADGKIYRPSVHDVDELTQLSESFHEELKLDQKDHDQYRIEAEEMIQAGNIFFWQNNEGNNVACCRFVIQGNIASLGHVFTRPEFRRKHYAQNLVYEVTKLAKDGGFIPMLYTDGDYVASNSCYKKIGYIFRGKLCTIK